MSSTNLRDIIAARMRRPFTRLGLAQAILDAEPDMSPSAAKRRADAAVDHALESGLIMFSRDIGMFRPAGDGDAA